MRPEYVPADELAPVSARYPRLKARWIFTPQPEGWKNYAISEWELGRAGFADFHPHDESAYVLEGELHVESGGVETIGRPGDTIRVPAGSVGRYWAPVYARMLGIYGPNPDGARSETLEYWEIDD